MRSTRQQAIGSKAGARNASPVRRLKHAGDDVQRATHRVSYDQALRERPMIVTAGRTDREQFFAAPNQHHVFAAGAAEHCPAVGNAAEGHARVEIRLLVQSSMAGNYIGVNEDGG